MQNFIQFDEICTKITEWYFWSFDDMSSVFIMIWSSLESETEGKNFRLLSVELDDCWDLNDVEHKTGGDVKSLGVLKSMEFNFKPGINVFRSIFGDNYLEKPDWNCFEFWRADLKFQTFELLALRKQMIEIQPKYNPKDEICCWKIWSQIDFDARIISNSISMGETFLLNMNYS